VADGGGDRRHVAERRGVVDDGGAAEGVGGGGGGGGALEAVDRRDVELVRAEGVGHLLGGDLDLLLGRRFHADHAVDSHFDTWQEVAVVGEGAGGAGVAEHRAGHRQVRRAGAGAATAAFTLSRALTMCTTERKKKSNQYHLQGKKKQPRLLHGVVLLHLQSSDRARVVSFCKSWRS
jgi:hypothetical protein